MYKLSTIRMIIMLPYFNFQEKVNSQNVNLFVKTFLLKRCPTKRIFFKNYLSHIFHSNLYLFDRSVSLKHYTIMLVFKNAFTFCGIKEHYDVGYYYVFR